jgi:hypothetical protein
MTDETNGISEYSALTSAMLTARQNMERLTKDAKNPHFGNKYPTLPAVLDVVLPALHEQGLLLYQTASYDNELVVVTSSIIHTPTGAALSADLALPVAKRDPPGIGSAITYGRRYLLLAQCSLAADDDDGAAASGQQQQSRGNAPVLAQQPRKVRPAGRGNPPVVVPSNGSAPRQAPPPPEPGHIAKSPDELGSLEWYASIFNNADIEFDADVVDFLVELHSIEEQGRNPMPTELKPGKKMTMYGWLCKEVDDIAGAQMHGPVLSVICGKPVHKGNPPSFDAGNHLLGLIGKSKDEHTIDLIGRIAALCRTHTSETIPDEVFQ